MNSVCFYFSGNFVDAIQTAFASGVGWLISFCNEHGGKYVHIYLFEQFQNRVVNFLFADEVLQEILSLN